MIQILSLICALSFLGYGFSCIFSQHMIAEFNRYGLPKYRFMTGVLQIGASVGLLLGLVIPWVGGVASAGLALQMACGLGVRVRIADPWYLCLPAAIYMIICGCLATQLL